MQRQFLLKFRICQSLVSLVKSSSWKLKFAAPLFNILLYCLHAEVTGKAIEETAAVIVRIYFDRKQKCSMPRISKRY